MIAPELAYSRSLAAACLSANGRRTVLKFATALLILFLSSGAASRLSAFQEDPGEPGVIEGRVLDGAGRPVVAAKVWVEERGRPRTGALHYVATDTEGYFRIAYLRVGIYEVFVSAEHPPAFLSKPLASVRLTDDKPERRVTLRLGSPRSVPRSL